MVDKKKSKKDVEFEKKINELTEHLQRTRADFENYVKRSDNEKAAAREAGQASAILKLLPVIDNIERAVVHIPVELKDNTWAQGIEGLVKNLEKLLEELNLKRIDARPGTPFNPNLHDAILFDESTESDSPDDEEVIAEEMQPGYTLNGQPIRHSMVKVTRK
jgi:molecular chaperone GrpE